MSDGALAGYRVLDLSDSIAGQFCCRMLADYGAEVILAEPPSGTQTRRMPPHRDDGGSVLFEHLNIGKHSVVIDSADTLTRLAAVSDVIVVPAGADRARLRAASPNAIIETVSPFGEDGPRAHWQGSEMIYQALSGMMIHNGRNEREPLFGVGNRASFCAGIAAYITVLAALMVRERTGVAQDIAVDIAHAAASMTYPFALQYSYNGSIEERGKRGQPLIEVKCADNWISIWIRIGQFPLLCETLGAPELITDPRFADEDIRKANFDTLIAEIQARVADRNASELVNMLAAKRLVAACCFRPSQLGPNAPHLQARNFWQQVPGAPGHLALGPQFIMSGTPRSIRGPAPALGQSA